MNPEPRASLNSVLAQTVVVTLMAYAAWFGGLMTGVIRLDWLTRWLGTPKLQRPWDAIALFGPAAIVGLVYFLVALIRSHETRG